MKLYHRTTDQAAAAILDQGFQDATAAYMTTHDYTGVWLSDMPIDANEGAVGDVLLEVTLNVGNEVLGRYEWVEEGKRYREFLVPAEVVNRHGTVRVVAGDEEDTIWLVGQAR
jgi:hypothetical protein